MPCAYSFLSPSIIVIHTNNTEMLNINEIKSIGLSIDPSGSSDSGALVLGSSLGRRRFTQCFNKWLAAEKKVSYHLHCAGSFLAGITKTLKSDQAIQETINVQICSCQKVISRTFCDKTCIYSH